MSIRYEWTTAVHTMPEIVAKHHLPNGEPVAPEDRDDYADKMVTRDLALILGDGNPLVIEGTYDELAGLLRDCIDRLDNHRKD